MPPPTNTTASPPSRGRQKKPHYRISHTTTTTTPPNSHHPPQHTPHHKPPHRPNPTPCTTPAAVQQHLRGPGDQEVLRLHTSGTLGRLPPRRPTRPPPTRHPRPREPAPHGGPNLVLPIDWGRHLVGHPVPERMDTQGGTRYHEPDMAQPPTSATPSDTKAWERETWVARMASLSNFRHHVPGDVPNRTTSSQPPPRT